MFVLDLRTGATVTTLDHVSGVQWIDSGGRVLLAREGSDRTELIVLDRDCVTRTQGSVPGFGLHCQAMAATLACSDPAGIVRVWPLPL